LNPNAFIDPVAAKAWLERKSVSHFKALHPLRDEVSTRLMAHLEGMVLEPSDILCWQPLCAGQLALNQLKDRFPKAKHHFWQESDSAKALLRSSTHSKGWGQMLKRAWTGAGNSAWHPFELKGNAQADLIYTSLALHNEPDPMAVIQAWANCLRPQGVAIFSCWGPDTLKELRALYSKMGWSEPMHPLVDMHNWGDLLVQNGLSDPVMDMEYLTLTYERVEVLMSDLRFLGRNLNPTRVQTLRPRAFRQALTVALEEERIRLGGRLSLTFEVVYGHAFKGMPKATMQGETQVSLQDMKLHLKTKRSPSA